MNVAVIDPGYDHSHSHHETVNLGLVRALKEHKLEYVLITAAALAADARETLKRQEVNFVPFFRTPAYPSNVETLSAHDHSALSRNFQSELTAAFDSGILPNGSYVFLHTAYAFHISGVAQALLRLPPGAVQGVYISLMFDPGVKVVSDRDWTEGISIFNSGRYLKYKMALKLLSEATMRKSCQLLLETSCESYRSAYASVAPDLAFGIHPIVTFDTQAPTPLPTAEERVLLYVGGPKENKGIRFTVKVAEQLRNLHSKLKLQFHFNAAFPGGDQFQQEITILKNIGGIEILEGNLGADAYQRLIDSSTVICLLYDPESYFFKTSGVLWDGLRNSRIKWVVSADTWMASELSHLGIRHASVRYGNVSEAVEAIASTAKELPQSNKDRSPSQQTYSHLLLQSFGHHVVRQLDKSLQQSLRESPPVIGPGFEKEKRILVVRTKYEHFGRLSGPGGFVADLERHVARIDEVQIPLGEGQLNTRQRESIQGVWGASRNHLASYQLNSVLVEHQILSKLWRDYDVIHFLDAEHTGLLTAMGVLSAPSGRRLSGPKLVATFHQPNKILSELIANPTFLNGFDAIHVLSPCQSTYFQEKTSTPVFCIAHGIAPELIRTYIDRSEYQSLTPPDLEFNGIKLILTTGNWLRDFDSLIGTASLLQGRDGIRFIVVSKGLELNGLIPSNVQILNRGISDEALHSLYERADVLFLPLLDGAANNAMLEAMVHGLPIVTTDLPSTRYYTSGLASFCRRAPEDYAEKLLAALARPKEQDVRPLQDRARDLGWDRIAAQMLKELYQ